MSEIREHCIGNVFFHKVLFFASKKKSLNASHVISLKRGTGFMV